MMKKLMFFVSMVLCSSLIYAAPISKLIFFGDSLTDNGNLYNLIFKIIPRSPPYFRGRFSNGPTWAEHVGKYYYDKYYIDYEIYAYGGATAIYHQFTGKFLAPTILEIELYKYLLESIFQDRSEVLYSIWIGGNDYLFDEDTDVDVVTSKVVEKIDWAIRTLISYGGQNFLIFNLPDLSKVPFSRNTNSAQRLYALTVSNNLKLFQTVENLRHEFPNVKIVFMNVFDIFQAMLADPEKFNREHNTHISNTTEACWQGGFFLENLRTYSSLRHDLQKALARNTNKDIQLDEVQDFILQSPVISHAYQMGKAYEMGISPCISANSYIFWDAIHPTEIIHSVLAQVVEKEISFSLADKLSVRS